MHPPASPWMDLDCASVSRGRVRNRARWEASGLSEAAATTANCIIIAPKRLKLRLSGSARKSQKRFRDTPMFKFQAVLARTQPFHHAA
jgi:hypothetical protein